MEIQHLTSNNLVSTLENMNKTILIDFYSDWCDPCKKIAPIMEEISNEREDVCVYKINTEEEPELATQFAIKSIPTILIIKQGKIQNTIVGFHEKQFILDLL